MKDDFHLRLGPCDIEKLSSHYLNEGRKQESWQIDNIQINADVLLAQVSMRSTYISKTDAHGFHLTIFSTLEFLSQLMIIYAHAWAGLRVKVREGWMVESTARCLRAIRNPDAILVEMRVHTMRQRAGHLYCVADFQVTDDNDGLFKVTLKGFLS